jgi:hypothetical protein
VHPKSNRKVERYYFKIVRDHSPLAGQALVPARRAGAVLRAGRKVGIEVSNFLLQDGRIPRSEQIQARAREHVVAEAQRLYELGNGKGMRLVFGFNGAHPIRNLDDLIQRIVEVAKRVEGCGTGPIERRYLRLVPELSFLYLLGEGQDDSRWRVDQLHATRQFSARRLREIIKAKEAEWRSGKAYQAYWLLVVVDTVKSAEGGRAGPEGFTGSYTEAFEKIVVHRTILANIMREKYQIDARRTSMRPGCGSGMVQVFNPRP